MDPRNVGPPREATNIVDRFGHEEKVLEHPDGRSEAGVVKIVITDESLASLLEIFPTESGNGETVRRTTVLDVGELPLRHLPRPATAQPVLHPGAVTAVGAVAATSRPSRSNRRMLSRAGIATSAIAFIVIGGAAMTNRVNLLALLDDFGVDPTSAPAVIEVPPSARTTDTPPSGSTTAAPERASAAIAATPRDTPRLKPPAIQPPPQPRNVAAATPPRSPARDTPARATRPSAAAPSAVPAAPARALERPAPREQPRAVPSPSPSPQASAPGPSPALAASSSVPPVSAESSAPAVSAASVAAVPVTGSASPVPAAAAAPSGPPASSAPTVATRAPATPAASSAPGLTDETRAVAMVLNRYQQAFSALDANAAHAVWPTVDVKALAKAFGQLDEQTFELEGCNISVAGARAEADCSGNARYIRKVGSRALRVEPRHWHFRLRQADAQWVIDAVDAR